MQIISLVEIMQALYGAEINCEVSSFWDGGFTVRLGDSMNGYPWEENYTGIELPSAGRDLLLAALRRYPKSKLFGFDGERINEKVGWLGKGASHIDIFQCEFCGAEHLDCTLIEHNTVCFVTKARAAIAER